MLLLLVHDAQNERDPGKQRHNAGIIAHPFEPGVILIPSPSRDVHETAL